jgi:hypothetical protein
LLDFFDTPAKTTVVAAASGSSNGDGGSVSTGDQVKPPSMVAILMRLQQAALAEDWYTRRVCIESLCSIAVRVVRASLFVLGIGCFRVTRVYCAGGAGPHHYLLLSARPA